MRARFAAAALLAPGAAGHGTMVQPMPRAMGGHQSAPSFPGAGPNFPGCAGDACLWYSVGCYIGCPACSSVSAPHSPPDYLLYATPATNGDDGHGGPCTAPMEPTNNDATQRTNNPHNTSPRGDWTKYMPWRAPGFAPSVNPCGVAGAFKPPSRGGSPGEVPAGHTQYENGTTLPPLTGNPVVWKAGQAVEVAWAISANHGGGYQYRVCPKSAAEPTEACFRAHVLPFTEPTTTIHYTDGSRADVVIPSVSVTTGTNPPGSAWKKNPVPMCNCDIGVGCKAKPSKNTSMLGCASCFKAYEVDPQAKTETPECPTGLQFPRSWDEGFGEGGTCLYPQGPSSPTNCSPYQWTINDRVRAPATPGNYIVSFRWDCEHTPQVWNQCADVTVEA